MSRARLSWRIEVEDDRHVVDAHAGRRLVEHVDARLERHQHRHLELPLVAVRQAARRGVDAVAEAHLLDQRARPLERLLAIEPHREQAEALVALRLHREANVLEHAQVREQLRQLERAAEAAVGARRHRLAGDVGAVQPDRAGAGAQLARDQVEVGRLAGAVRADDRGQRAGREGARDAVDGDVAAEADREVACLEHLSRHPERSEGSRPSRIAILRLRLRTTDPGQRLFLIGMFISSGLISRTSSGTPQANAGSFLIRVWIHRLHRLMVFLAEGHLALGRLEAHAFHRLDELLGAGVAAGLLQRLDQRDRRRSCRRAVKKSGGVLNLL